MKRVIAIPLFISFFITMSYGQSFTVIASKNLNLKNVSATELIQIFKGEKTRIAGRKITLVYLVNKSKVQFYQKIFGEGVTPLQVGKYWVEQGKKGKRKPERLAVSGGVVRYVSQNKNAIGYIESNKLNDSSVQAVRIENKSPGDADYFLDF